MCFCANFVSYYLVESNQLESEPQCLYEPFGAGWNRDNGLPWLQIFLWQGVICLVGRAMKTYSIMPPDDILTNVKVNYWVNTSKRFVPF